MKPLLLHSTMAFAVALIAGLGHPRFLSKLVEPQSALQLTRACRRFPPWRGQRLGEVREHEIERDADALGRALVGGNVVPEPGREDHHAARLRLGDGGVGGNAAELAGPGHHQDRSRVLENECRATLGYGDIVDTAQVIVRVIVGGVVGAGRIDVCPAARDHHRKTLDLKVLRDAAGGDLDQLGEVGEGRTCVQILRRLPVAAARYLRARRDDILDFRFELGVEGCSIRRGKVDDPKRRGEEFLDFLLYSHPLTLEEVDDVS
jgi:hypothetical protein